MEFKVVKINQEFRNVVVSHKALIEAELEAQKKEIITGSISSPLMQSVFLGSSSGFIGSPLFLLYFLMPRSEGFDIIK